MDNKWWINNTLEKITAPEIRAKQAAEETVFPEITIGSEKQIKFAKDLRANFLETVTNVNTDAQVRWVAIKISKKETLGNTDSDWLAWDAWYRRAIKMLITDDAKSIIDHFKSLDMETKRNSAISKYRDIIAHPANWEYKDNSWQRIWKK